jgi:hypothetical protein
MKIVGAKIEGSGLDMKIEGAPIKRLSVKGKNVPLAWFLSLADLNSYRHPYHCRYFFRCDVSLRCIQSPIRIKAV